MLKLINEKLVIELELLSIRVLLGKVTLKVGQEKYLSLVLSRKVILGLTKLKIQTEKKLSYCRKRIVAE